MYALAGGAMIGAAAALLLLTHGRIAGIKRTDRAHTAASCPKPVPKLTSAMTNRGHAAETRNYYPTRFVQSFKHKKAVELYLRCSTALNQVTVFELPVIIPVRGSR